MQLISHHKAPPAERQPTHDGARGALHASGPAAALGAPAGLLGMACAGAGRGAAPRAAGLEPHVPPAAGVAAGMIMGFGRHMQIPVAENNHHQIQLGFTGCIRLADGRTVMPDSRIMMAQR